ncbi:uncharacterized protein B0H18DRAFT_1159102 [Fomitopsis serialis]|uniref:uncharacterized protein n=1 Tax=Fomitopsis serialis TaxID=139415 RepID=UPI002008E3E6|nr:uncharacterized protein B0H18DRAFT_1159102 [Neoantrodia serialis]KAH9928225.1 hypothetical protein B0H18DRAFT_1159102 [Neoantrodia serialis]
MPGLLPTVEQIEDYMQSIEELLFSSLQAATPDLPRVNEAIHRLWEDVSRFGPQSLPPLPDLHIPGLGAFEVPPPPPPPPPPPSQSFLRHTAHWVADHPWTTAGITFGAVGAGLLVGYGYYHAGSTTVRVRASASSDRRQVVVVLGGDSPSGLPLILELEKKGFVVITSVSTPEAVADIERNCHGYVRALVLDPSEPETIPYFLRSLSSTLSRRFPITAAGDPHASPSHHLHVHSVISLLTLPSPSVAPPPAPLEHLSLQDAYSTYLTATHITPLQIIQALLPLRANPARARDAFANNLGKKSIVVCLPAIDARVGLPFAGAQAMSAAATLRAMEVLRREVKMAALTDASASMKNIKVVVVDVGAIGVAPASEPVQDVRKSVQEWTPSEKVAYGTAFEAVVEEGMHYSVHRKPTDVSVFVNTIVDVVGGGRKSGKSAINAMVHLSMARIRDFIRGDRVVVGAGGTARTYALASYLPGVLLDTILNIPHFLISIRNALLPIQPHVILPQSTYTPPVPPTASVAPTPAPPAESQLPAQEQAVDSDPEQHDNASETGSEADVESNAGSGVGESWISVKDE